MKIYTIRLIHYVVNVIAFLCKGHFINCKSCNGSKLVKDEMPSKYKCELLLAGSQATQESGLVCSNHDCHIFIGQSRRLTR